MPLPLDEVFRRMTVAKGDVPATRPKREEGRQWYRVYIDDPTRMAQHESPGNLSITHESMQAAAEEAYREYRRQKDQAAARRRLWDRD
ncbi:MAG: hypothetical protein HYY24_26770 [Verrucomicrobia bacterium]|nr:hypothetical protein [Verrucomicrobiota bacterium]